MHSHTLLLRLHCSPGDIRMFEKSFYLIAKMHNALVREMKKRLRMLYRDPVYTRHRHSYGRIKRLLDKKISVKLRQYCEQELDFHANVMNERVKLYGLGEHDGEKFLLPMQHKLEMITVQHYFGSMIYTENLGYPFYQGGNVMSDGMFRKVAVFSVWCITISIGIRFLRSDVWKTIKHMTPEEVFALHPEYFVCFVIGSLFLIGLIEVTTILWTKRD